MNFKALTEYTLKAREFEAKEVQLSGTTNGKFYGIEARKMRGEIAALIFGFAHYKGATKMEIQRRLNPCYQ